jgi:membrane-associated phospholipid phosphatase
MKRRSFAWIALAVATIDFALAASAFAGRSPKSGRDVFGPSFEATRSSKKKEDSRRAPSDAGTLARFRHWNRMAVDASGLDHTPPAPGETREFAQQLGPGRSSRAMAIVHIAMFDSILAVEGGYKSYTGLRSAPRGTSIDAAIAQSAHDTLVALFPAQKQPLDQALADDLAQIRTGDRRSKEDGIKLGRSAAALILALRANDGSKHDEPVVGVDFFTSDEVGKWRQDPISLIPLALGAHWGEVRPFVLRSGAQFRTPPPPALTSPAYTGAFDEVKELGGDGVVTPTSRSEDQTIAGIYWAYDGTPSLCAPPRLYNQIAMQIAEERHSNLVQTARLAALINIAMADAGIAIWESKYFYEFWRPVTGIRESDPGTGPSQLGDGNPDTVGDPAFSPLGAPASNSVSKNFTPPFPAYPSGHAGFGGALFQILRRFYGTDAIAFTFVSDEFNGVTQDNQGNVRPLIPRSFSSLSQAEEENGQSRIYLGIHWAFDKTEGIAQGRAVADYVFRKAYLPLRSR